ncbi:MAG: hypothetical protein ACUVS7_05020 [Bryobacteraceae bacterium]
MIRLERRDALLLLPAPVVLLWLDWHGLRSWFHQDDFAWLSLGRRIGSFADLVQALFAPAAQGTVRVLSERLFFVGLERIFGLDHRPFHLVVLATQVANLALLYWITLRLSRSRVAATVAPLVWSVGLGVAVPLAWLSAYNQILCAFFLLGAFACLLRWLETGRGAWFAAQFAIFLLGFGALEVAVVYPALATIWCWLEGRRLPPALLWLWLASAVFTAAHMLLIPKPAGGVYARHWDLSMARTYAQYWSLALAGDLDPAHWPVPWLPRRAVAALCSLAALVWLVLAWRARNRLAVFGFVWFTVAIAPVLPLRDHVMAYYVTIPAIGLAWMAVTALDAARRGGLVPMALVSVLLGLHLLYVGAAHRTASEWHYQRGLDARYLFHALERAVELHPGKLIAVTGIGNELFWSAFSDSRLLWPSRICLDPGSATAVQLPPGFPSIDSNFCSPAELGEAARTSRLAAYRWENRRLRAMTRLYLHRLPREWLELPPSHLDLEDLAADRWLVSGWHEPEPGGRWTRLRATATLAAPDRPGRKLAIYGYRPSESLNPPVLLIARVDGSEAGRILLRPAGASFHLECPLPPPKPGARTLRVELEVNRALQAPGDRRELGVVISRIAWQ